MTPAPTIHVFTYKDGLLARLAHDLRLSLRRFEVVKSGTTITGRFWPDSLVVDGVVERSGQVDTRALSEADRKKIAGNIADEILLLARFPEAVFTGTVVAGGAGVEGSLTLVGKAAPVNVSVEAVDGRLRANVTLVPSRWGVAPYRALAGAIKLQDRVLVKIDFPAGVERWVAG
jgi:hypothetical protein